MVEEWRDITGYEGLYQVSNLGRVRSLDRKVRTYQGWRTVKGRVLKTPINSRGYPKVHLRNEPVGSQVFVVHQLVAKAFIPNPDGKPFIDHIDGNKANNAVGNLRWVTPKENSRNPITYEKVRKVGERAKVCSHTPQAEAKRSRSLKGLLKWGKHPFAKPIRNETTGMTFSCVNEAADFYKVAPNAISSAIKRNGTSCGGRWRCL